MPVRAVLMALAASALLVSASPAGFIKTQSFDSDPGWTGVRNRDGSIGNNFGFSNTNNTGGSSPAGEAGGTFARASALSFYGDANLGGTLTLSDRIESSGEFTFTGLSNFNNGIFVGHRGTTAIATGAAPADLLGFYFAENQGIGFRFVSDIYLSDGTELRGGEVGGLVLGEHYTWTTLYDPTIGQGLLSVEFFHGATSLGVSSVAIGAQDRAVGVSLDAFGIGSGGLGQVSATNQATVYIDNLRYTAATPEPSSVSLIGIGCAGLLGYAWRRRARGSTSVAPVR